MKRRYTRAMIVEAIGKWTKVLREMNGDAAPAEFDLRTAAVDEAVRLLGNRVDEETRTELEILLDGGIGDGRVADMYEDMMNDVLQADARALGRELADYFKILDKERNERRGEWTAEWEKAVRMFTDMHPEMSVHEINSYIEDAYDSDEIVETINYMEEIGSYDGLAEQVSEKAEEYYMN